MATPVVNQQPTLWRRILGGALAGMVGGMAAESPDQAPAAAMKFMQGNEDRQLERRLLMNREQREERRVGFEEQRLGMDQQRLGLEQQRTAAELKQSQANLAVTQIQIKALERNLSLLPQTKQEQMEDDMRKMFLPKIASGDATVITFGEDKAALEQEMTKLMGQNSHFGYFVTPHPEKPGMYALLRIDRGKTTQPTPIVFEGEKIAEIPAGTDKTAEPALIAGYISAHVAMKTAQLAYSRELAVERAKQSGKTGLTPAQEKQMADLDNAEAQIMAIKAMYEDNKYQGRNWVGKAQGAAGRVKEFFNYIGPNEAAFRKEVQSFKARQMHELYGSALTPTELKNALQAVMHLGMGNVEFEKATESQLNWVRMAKTNLLSRAIGSVASAPTGTTSEKITMRVKINGRVAKVTGTPEQINAKIASGEYEKVEE